MHLKYVSEQNQIATGSLINNFITETVFHAISASQKMEEVLVSEKKKKEHLKLSLQHQHAGVSSQLSASYPCSVLCMHVSSETFTFVFKGEITLLQKGVFDCLK